MQRHTYSDCLTAVYSPVDIHFWIHFSCDVIGPDQTKTKQGWPKETGTNQTRQESFCFAAILTYTKYKH